MKLATYRDGSRDGQLVVVSRDLGLAHYATGIATRLQQALDDWPFIAPQLEDLYQTLNQGKARHAFPFEPRQCMAPLPRPGTRLQLALPDAPLDATGRRMATSVASATPSTLPPSTTVPAATAPAARGTPSDDQDGQDGQDGHGGDAARRVAEAADAFAPGLTLRPAQPLLGPCEDLRPGHAAWGVRLEAGVCAICADLDPGADAAQGLDALRLLMLCADAWLHRPPGGPSQAHAAWLASACSPVAVTPDELGPAWRSGRLHGQLRWQLNQQRGRQRPLEAWPARHLGQWIADAALTRPLAAGTLLGLAVEALGAADPLQPGDRLRLDLLDPQGASLCGGLDLRVRVAGMAEDDDAPPEPEPPASDAPDAPPSDSGPTADAPHDAMAAATDHADTADAPSAPGPLDALAPAAAVDAGGDGAAPGEAASGGQDAAVAGTSGTSVTSVTKGPTPARTPRRRAAKPSA